LKKHKKKMTNNKQQTAVKLYTEEQVREALRMTLGSLKISTENDIISALTPIELPSDEEIEKANPFVFGSKHLGTRDMDIWELGAKWMRNKIQGGEQ
jgi:hypothetical protein